MKKLLTEYYQLQLTPEQLNEATSAPSGAPLILKKVLVQRADSKNRNGRKYPKAILEREIAAYNDNFVKSRRALGELDHCFTQKDFDVLTESGWKSFDEVVVGELILSYNIDKNIYEYKKVLRKIDSEYSGDSYIIKARNIDTQVTPEHKFPIEGRYGDRKLVTIEEIYNDRKKFNKSKIIKRSDLLNNVSDKFILKGSIQNKNGISTYCNDLEIDTKIFAGILGIWLAEGHIATGKNCVHGQVVITQNKGEKYDEIIELLENSPFDWYAAQHNPNSSCMNIYIKNHQLYDYLKPLGDCYIKYIPTEVKNFDKESLENLLHFFKLGDGRTQINDSFSRNNVFTVSKKLIDDLQECLIKIGLSGNLTIGHKAGQEGGYIRNGDLVVATTDLHQLNFSTVSGIYLDNRFVKIEKVYHEGRKYCLEVEDNHTFYVRQRNKCFITGNCNENTVNLKNVSHLFTEMWWEGDDVYANIEVLNAPEFPAGRIMEGLIKRRIPVGFSTRGMGSVTELDENTVEVNDDFSLLCIDAVSYESTQGANYTLQEGYVNNNDNKYKKLDDIIYEIICNNSGACSCMFDKK